MRAQTKEEIANDIKESLTKSMASFGYQIIQTLVTGARDPAAAALWQLARCKGTVLCDV